MSKLPEGKARERAISSFINTVSYQSPEHAAPWVGSIADENQRYYSSRNIFQQWMQYDRPAAEKWIASVNITDAKRQEILKMK